MAPEICILSVLALYAIPDPNPDLLAGVLRILAPQHAEGHSVYEPRMCLAQYREGVDVPPGSARDQLPISGAAYPWGKRGTTAGAGLSSLWKGKLSSHQL
jgi:hypothetical protein